MDAVNEWKQTKKTKKNKESMTQRKTNNMNKTRDNVQSTQTVPNKARRPWAENPVANQVIHKDNLGAGQTGKPLHGKDPEAEQLGDNPYRTRIQEKLFWRVVIRLQ